MAVAGMKRWGALEAIPQMKQTQEWLKSCEVQQLPLGAMGLHLRSQSSSISSYVQPPVCNI